MTVNCIAVRGRALGGNTFPNIVDNTINRPYGYIPGGYSRHVYCKYTDVINFSTGVAVRANVSNLSTRRINQANLSDLSAYGYTSGGLTGRDGVCCNTTDLLTYSTGMFSLKTTSDLPTTRKTGCATTDGKLYGYICGGEADNYTKIKSIVQVTFSSQIMATKTSMELSAASAYLGSTWDSGAYGYILGCTITGWISWTSMITFSSETCAARTAANLTTARYTVGCMSDEINFGYAVCGLGDKVNHSKLVDVIVFSSQTTNALTSANFSVSSYNFTGVSNGTTYGYIVGGACYNSDLTQIPNNITFKMTFSTQIISIDTTCTLEECHDEGIGSNGLA